MKTIILMSLVVTTTFGAQAQLKATPKCNSFTVDILNGTVNNIKSNISIPEIKDRLPCFTGVDDEGGSGKCGPAVYYKDKDVVFYTQRNYTEIGDKFKGQLSLPVLGASRNSLFKWFGNPKVKDDTWDAFEMSYGTLVLHYNAAGKVILIQMSTRNTESLTLCQ